MNCKRKPRNLFWSHNNYKLIIDPPFRNWWPAIEQKPHTRPERPECLCTMALFLEKKIFLIICYFFQRWPIRATESKQAILTFPASLPETTLGSIKHMHCVLFWFVFLPYYCKRCLYSLWHPGIRTLFAATTFDCHLFTQYIRQFMKAQVANRPLVYLSSYRHVTSEGHWFSSDSVLVPGAHRMGFLAPALIYSSLGTSWA